MAELLTRAVAPGEVIFREGDLADCAYIVTEGAIEIHTGSGSGERCVAVIGAGELLGEMAMLDNAPRSATAVALAPTILTVIDRSQLITRLASADPVLHLLLKVLLNRLRGQLHDEPAQSEHPASVVQDAVLERIRLENELKAGLGAGEMRLHLQPIADANSRRIHGFESLVRWQHPQRGMVRPDLFIKVAEESGLIIPLGRWILREACLASLRLDREANSADVHGKDAFISVNVSTGQFHDPEFIPMLAATLQETGLNPHRLKLEITESVLTNAEAAKKWIDDCKALGVRIALDDFGTGYSSLSYLHEFNIDTLKIDQSFVRRMLQDERSAHIVATIITLGKLLGMEIITEGVETEDHLQRLAALGCDYAQGYLIARPASIDSYFERV
ncbi:EAL domain-containing protein [Permianibacter sp. IMCC34836]|uniref:EAL domain-containing protein n=1 Tax=Permianibacter fluminis TaxID=2738515 RepID=UPI0015520AE8|nr:EAL domain-containing protein [Permianibacter fluminis]NQD36105.1 EAL domain-containing protein [Permianibacter fluminis]